MVKTWLIKPTTTPVVLRSCSRCGCRSEFLCSGDFRINAQQRKLDVWLIYKCRKCNSTWNMDIFTRVRPEELDKELYEGFLENNGELAFRYAFDVQTLDKNRVRACYDDVEYTLEGDDIMSDLRRMEPVTLRIVSPYDLHIRSDKLLSRHLGLTRSAVRALMDEGVIEINREAGGSALGGMFGLTLQLKPGIYKREGENSENEDAKEDPRPVHRGDKLQNNGMPMPWGDTAV